MAYITKAKDGLVQLWNNKPIYIDKYDIWYAWKVKGREAEVGIDITANDTLRNSVTFETSPMIL